MALKWWEKKEDSKEEEVELPKAIQDQLDQVKEVKTQVSAMDSKLSKLDGITEWIESQKAEAAKRNEPKPKTQTTEEAEAEEAEISAMFLRGESKAAYARLAANTNAAVMLVRADNVKREVFEDNADKFPYYSGDVKTEINKILSKQSLEFRNNPEALENTYYTVVGKMQKEIQEGKIKDRFASASSGRSSGTSTEDGDKKKITVNADIERAARLTGLKTEDYVALLEQDVDAYV